MEFKVGSEDVGLRLDKFLSNKSENISRAFIQKIISENKVFVNGKSQKASYRVNSDDIVNFEMPTAKEATIKPENIELDIIYEDTDILVINKAKGMVVHPGNGNQNGTLANAVMEHCQSELSGIGGKIRPGIVHRLDKDTTGIMIVAKNDLSHISLSEQIKNRTVNKIYIALVRGEMPNNSGKIDMPIARDKVSRVKMSVDKEGKKAITDFKVLKRFKGYTLLELKIETGRTHQIRVHLSEIGYPVIGDEIYSNGKNPFNVKGQMLHSKILEFEHPKTKEHMHFEAKTPEYFEKIIMNLEEIEDGRN